MRIGLQKLPQLLSINRSSFGSTLSVIQKARYSTDNIKKIIPNPIHVFNVEDFGLSKEEFVKEVSPHFYEVMPDELDQRKRQIRFLKKKFSDFEFNHKVVSYFKRSENPECLDPFYGRLSLEEKHAFDQILPRSYKAVSKYTIDFSRSRPCVTRTNIQLISKNIFVKNFEEELNMKILSKPFAEISYKSSSSDALQCVMIEVAKKVRKLLPFCYLMNMVVHHTKIVARAESVSYIHPETITQRGSAFVMSGLVVESEKIEPVENILFGPDKKTKVFSMQTSQGTGLIHPDYGSDLWQTASKVKLDLKNYPLASEGYMNMLEFEIEPV